MSAVGLATARPIGAQLPIPAFSLAGGVSNYDMAGTGTAPFGVARVDIPLLIIIAEGSIGVFRPTEKNDVHRTYIIPEAQIQYQFLPLLVRPYVGVGAGLFKAIAGPDPRRRSHAPLELAILIVRCSATNAQQGDDEWPARTHSI